MHLGVLLLQRSRIFEHLLLSRIPEWLPSTAESSHTSDSRGVLGALRVKPEQAKTSQGERYELWN